MIEFSTKEVGITLPTEGTDFSVGWDFYNDGPDLICYPRTVTKYDTKISALLCQGWWMLLKERSSWGSKGLVVLGGVIDCDYIEDTIGFRLSNLVDEPIVIPHGERFVQGIQLPSLKRMKPKFDRKGGFGSTGK